MPANKNAVTRYYILDKLLANRYHHYSVEDLRQHVNEELKELSQDAVSPAPSNSTCIIWKMRDHSSLRLNIIKLIFPARLTPTRTSRRAAIVMQTPRSQSSKKR